VVLATVWRTSGERETGVGRRLLHDGHAIRWTDIGDSELARAIAGDAAGALERRRSATTSYRSPTGEVEVLLEYLAPPIPLVVFGGGPDAVPLVRLAKALGWHVTVVDARGAAANRVRFPQADAVIACPPEEVRARVPLTPHSNAVVMTHSYRRDLTLLEVLLPSPVRYLGLLGPRARAERLLHDASLVGLDASPTQLQRLHAPVGLDLGAEGPEEIALAILAEVQATLTRRAARPLRDRPGPIHERELEVVA
jgi:xanthine/CO dehydrogenase XdhC/CoxF family maturation factor